MSRRTEQVAEAIKEGIGTLIQRELRDPRLGFITVTRAEVTPDLKRATIYYSVLGTDEVKKETSKALEGASRFLRRELAHALQLRYMPALRFEFDIGVEHSDRIQRLLHDIQAEEAATRPEEKKSEVRSQDSEIKNTGNGGQGSGS